MQCVDTKRDDTLCWGPLGSLSELLHDSWLAELLYILTSRLALELANTLASFELYLATFLEC